MRRIGLISLTVLALACDSSTRGPSTGGGGGGNNGGGNGNNTETDAGTNNPAVDAGQTGSPDATIVVDAGPPPPVGVPVLGGGTHSMDSVTFTTVLTAQDGLNMPRDVAFHTIRANELWVVSRADSSAVVAPNIGTPQQTARRYAGGGNLHFMAQPSALAFSDNGNMATIHETDDLTQGPATPRDFMGPTLWSTDMRIFDGGHAGHIDMLHNSPNGMGIAWETGNVFWVFDGFHSSITRYDFVTDHGPGGSDHSDGRIRRYVEGQVQWSEDTPSHMVIDHSTNLLYIADSGNNRIVSLDITAGNRGQTIRPNYDGVVQYMMDGAQVVEVINGQASGLARPSGLELHNGMLFVGDNATGTIYAFNMQGEIVDWLSTGFPTGSLMGMAFDAEGRLYVTDALGDRVVQIAPKQ